MSRASPQTIVLKFGSSVLQSAAALPVAVAEIYRHYRDGARVIAVVSAFDGVTDALWAQSRALTESPDGATLAALASTGEISCAAQLTLAVHRTGIAAELTDPRDIEFTAIGDRNNALAARVRIDLLNERLTRARVLIVPGFFAKSLEGGVSLLGRGGSDLTALFLADALGARCILLKDVDGLYEADPAQKRAHPRRFVLANYATAESHAGPLVQSKAIRLARERGLAVDIARVGSSLRTRIGEGPTIISPALPSKPIRVALLGLGTVGGGVLQYLNRFPERFEVVGALVRTPQKHIARGVPRQILTDSPPDVFARNPQIVVEALPGAEVARQCLSLALQGLMRVVTANKALLAADWATLSPRLGGPRRQIRYSAAVGGGVPMLESLERLSLRNPIVRLRGVLNGTCNFVVDRCATGDLFVNAVRGAQAEGFAESDPAEDLSGRDTARKMEILGRVAFGGVPSCEGVSGIDEDFRVPAESLAEFRTRLVAEAERIESGFTYRVGLRALPVTDFLADTRNAGNRLEITTADGTVTTLDGLGAGRIPTATAAFADLLEHGRVIESESFESVTAEFWDPPGLPDMARTP